MPKRSSPAWFNLDAVVEPDTVAELHRLADEVEKVVAGFESRLGEGCYRALRSIELAVAATGTAGGESYELIERWSGSGRLSDALYALANAVRAAVGERPEPAPAWWERARTDLGLDEWGVPVDR